MTIKLGLATLVCMTGLAVDVVADENPVVADENSVVGVKIGDNKKQVQNTLFSICDKLVETNEQQVSFSLAKNAAQHLVCENLLTGGKVAVTLADGKVVHVFAKDLAKGSVKQVKGENKAYLGYQVSSDYMLWRHHENRTVTLLSQKGLHPNLFVWESPYLSPEVHVNRPVDLTNGLPSILQFGASFKALKAELEAQCQPMLIKETKPWLPNKPEKQLQVNCFNLNYLGFPRKLEFVFGDDQLELVWILSAKEEEGRIRELLVDYFGPASNVTPDWETFKRGEVYLRKDKPEVLAVSASLVSHYLKQTQG